MTQIVERRLTDLLAFIVDNRGRTCPTAESGMPLIATNCVKDDELYPVFENIRFVDEATYSTWFRAHPIPGDVIFVCKGSPGRTALVPDPVPFCIAQDMVALRADPTVVDNRYLYYVLQSKETRRKIENMHVGTMIPHFKKGDFHRLVLPVHSDLGEQQAIAEVLGALDDKIAANIKQAGTAEDLLQCSYRGLINTIIPQRVRVGTLVRRIAPTRKFEKSELVRQGDFPVFDQSESGLLGYLNGDGFLNASTERPLLYFGDHTCKLRIATQRFTVGPNTVPFEGTSIPSLALYCALNGAQKSEEYKRHWQLLMAKEVLVPEAVEAEKFATRHAHLLALARGTNRENQTLSTTRDALLPQLMSGKLQVKDAEAIVAAAI